MDSLRLCLSCAGRKPLGSRNKRSRRDGGCVRSGSQMCPKVAACSSSVFPLSSIEEEAPASSVSDDSLEKILEHAAQDDQPDTPGYWRNRGIGDVDTPPIRRRGLLLPPPPLSTYSSSSNSISASVDSSSRLFPFLSAWIFCLFEFFFFFFMF